MRPWEKVATALYCLALAAVSYAIGRQDGEASHGEKCSTAYATGVQDAHDEFCDCPRAKASRAQHEGVPNAG